MPIIFSTIPTLIPVFQPDRTRVFFQAPDDALLANVVAEVARLIGRHQAYMFHEPGEVPAGLVPVVLNLSPGRGDSPPLRQPISPEHVQSLRAASAESWAACRQALRDADGDYDQALELLRIRAARRDMGRF